MDIKTSIEKHPVAISAGVGILGLFVTIYIIKKRQSNNSQPTATGVPTDASGNPLTGGFQLSPSLSQPDMTTQLQNELQSILSGVIVNPNTGKTEGDAGPPAGGKTNWWSKLLGKNPSDPTGASSWFHTTGPIQEQQLASLFGIQWQGIAYNSHNKALLSDSFSQQGHNVINGGTYVWIPTSAIAD